MKRSASMSIVFGLILLLIPALAYGQRGARGGTGVARGSGVGGATGSGVGGMTGTGVGGMTGTGVSGVNPSRRTMVIAAAASQGLIGDGALRDRVGDRPALGGGVVHPGLAAAAIARRVPVGTVIEVLPAGCAMTFLSEMEYYYCSGQYYQPMGAENDQIYVAVEPYLPEQY